MCSQNCHERRGRVFFILCLAECLTLAWANLNSGVGFARIWEIVAGINRREVFIIVNKFVLNFKVLFRWRQIAYH
jgi:hypothetical protein